MLVNEVAFNLANETNLAVSGSFVEAYSLFAYFATRQNISIYTPNFDVKSCNYLLSNETNFANNWRLIKQMKYYDSNVYLYKKID